MQLDAMTTDGLLDQIPATEDDRWEYKSASMLTGDKSKLQSELGKQVSAFANSGGGYIVFGVSDARNIENCEGKVGRQSMKDWLATIVESSVEYPIRQFKIHKIPFTNHPESQIFVVEISDSMAAPHQARVDKIYYYRIDGHSKPAPHFHVELLRNRITKSLVAIEKVSHSVQAFRATESIIPVKVDVELTNTSMQATTSLGLRVQMERENRRWQSASDKKPLWKVVFIRNPQGVLLPSERHTQTIELEYKIWGNPPDLWDFNDLFELNPLFVTPITHNSIGEPFQYVWPLSSQMYQDAFPQS